MRSLSRFCLLLVLLSAGCSGDRSGGSAEKKETAAREVVVYTALDRQFSEPILQTFEDSLNVRSKPVYDTEAVKTVGLVNRLIAERGRPACDVFWNNEIVRSIQLKREGVTEPFDSMWLKTLPPELKDPEGHWAGFAARARVILVNTELVPDENDWPTRVSALTDRKWKGRAAFAKPLFGTTSTHAAILWARDGEASLEFWRDALDNAVMYAGNAQARDAVADGEMAWCLTDTDDAYGAIEDGKPVRMIYPDSGPEEEGLILIPNTVVKIAGSPNSAGATMLIDYLLSTEVEAALAESRSAQIPVRDGIKPPAGIDPVAGLNLMEIDWEAVADALSLSQQALTGLLNDRQ